MGDTLPLLVRALLRLLPKSDREFIAGDLTEMFTRRIADGGSARAHHWLLRAALSSIVACRMRVRTRPLRRRPGVRMGIARDLLLDLRVGARSLRRRPGFTALAIITLALGIGATTAVFGMVNQVLLRPLPGVRDGESAGYLAFENPTENGRGAALSAPAFEELRTAVTKVDGLAGFGLTSVHIQSDDEVTAVGAQVIQGDFFELLGVRAAAGRLLTAPDVRPGADALVAVISDGLWSRLFGRDPGVIGRTIRVNSQSITIVGVAGGGFGGAQSWVKVDMWLPVSALGPIWEEPPEYVLDRERLVLNYFLVRPRNGILFDAAQADLARAYAQISSDVHQPRIYPRLGLEPEWRAPTLAALRVLAGVVLLVLLIACANVANMLLFRGVRRRGETAVRRALGGSHARIARLALAESLMLAAAGAAAGIAVAFGVAKILEGLSLATTLSFQGLTVDVRLLAFLTCAVVISTVSVGVLPAMLAGRVQLAHVLGDTVRRETGRGAQLRAAVTIVQLACSLCLLVSALLLVRTVRNLYAVDPGFEYEGITLVSISGPRNLQVEEIAPFQRRVLEELRSVPGMEMAALDAFGPFGPAFGGTVRLSGAPEDIAAPVRLHMASPAWFETLRLPIVSGRAFIESDWSEAGAQGVIVSDNLARRLFADDDPLGHTLTVRMTRGGDEAVTVVGVAADARLQGVDVDPQMVVYRTLAASQVFGLTGVLRIADPSDTGLESRVRNALHKAVPDLPAPGVAPLTDRLDSRIAEQRLFARLLAILSTLAVILAAVGLYGVIAYKVAERTREIGIRMALGAESGSIVRHVLGQAVWLVAVGTLLGLGAAIALSRILESRLFGVSPLDAGTYMAAVALFSGTALIACLAPVRAATRVDPMVALRSD